MSMRPATIIPLAILLVAGTVVRGEVRKGGGPKVRPAGHTSYAVGIEPGYAAVPVGDPCCPKSVHCCPPLIPAIFHGIDCLFKKIFCCNPCCVPDPCLLPSHRNYPACGCDAPVKGPIMVPGATDPFVDDPPTPSVTRRDIRLDQTNNTRPSDFQAVRRGRGEVSVYGNSAPRVLSVPQAAPLRTGQRATAHASGSSQTVRATSNDDRDMNVPENPLRK